MEILKLEQQRQALEANLHQLRQSLKQWQLWEAEYEGLKEEIQDAGEDVSVDGLERIATTYNGDLVNEKEVRDLTGLATGSPRSAKQIINLIERRQEYVQKNVETAQRQFFEAEAKQEELAFAAATQAGADQPGLPLTEIHEELDDDGNVISSTLSQPEEATAKVVESLRKVGVSEDDLEAPPKPKSRPSSEELKPAITNAHPPIPPSLQTVVSRKRSSPEHSPVHETSDGSHDDAERPTIRKKSVSFTADTKDAIERPRSQSRDGKKSVSFNDKIAVMPAAPPPDNRSVSFSAQVEEIPPQQDGPITPDIQPQNVEEIEKANSLMSSSGDTTFAIESEEVMADEVVIPDESPEDSRLRREMIDYHLNEVGNVVAQMDIDDADTYGDDYDEDDTSSYHTTSEYLDDEDTPYTTGLSESEDSEDEFGRSKHRQITPEYRKQMMELQNRLIGNLGPAPEDVDVVEADPELDPKDVRKLVIREKRNSTSSASSDNSEKKGGAKKRVSFAEELAVAEPGTPPLKAQKVQEGTTASPLADHISEKASIGHTSTLHQPSPGKPSRFKETRGIPPRVSESKSAVQSTIPHPSSTEPTPGDTPLRTTLLERPTVGKGAAAPSLEEPDAITARRELAEAYYSRRNDMVRQQGGFKVDPDDDEVHGELMEETSDGKLKKVSRFKAARLKGQ
jgi:unconventional prefoldin RPB5 interactor 1